jgi:hypothetical protein
MLVSDHPVCGMKVGFAEIFLMPQPPLLMEEGNKTCPNVRAQFHTFEAPALLILLRPDGLALRAVHLLRREDTS